MIIIDVDQGTPEWLQLKAGIPSSSCFGSIVTSKGEPSKSRDKYMMQLAGERVSGIKRVEYMSGAMGLGVEIEEEAAQCFREKTGFRIGLVGICFKDERKRYLSSPDRLILSNDGEPVGTLEIKSVAPQTQVERLLKEKAVPTEYKAQVYGQRLVTGLPGWFISYSTGIKPMIVEVAEDEVFMGKLEKELEKFCDELDVMVNRIKED